MDFDDEEETGRRSARIKLPLGVAVLVVIGLGVGWYLHTRTAPLPVVPASAGGPPAPTDAPPQIAHPVPVDTDAGRPVPPLPSLEASSAALQGALAATAGGADVTQYLVPDDLVRHLVVTVDNLPRQRVALDKRPVVPAPGRLATTGDEITGALSPANYARYQPMVDVLRNLDMQQVAAVYVHFYPLFQRVYQDLGYPNGYFNDRVVQVIDVLLATPMQDGPIALVRPNVMYAYADPRLESLPAGQKLLIRMGPDNAAVIEKKLKELRVILAGEPKL